MNLNSNSNIINNLIDKAKSCAPNKDRNRNWTVWISPDLKTRFNTAKSSLCSTYNTTLTISEFVELMIIIHSNTNRLSQSPKDCNVQNRPHKDSAVKVDAASMLNKDATASVVDDMIMSHNNLSNSAMPLPDYLPTYEHENKHEAMEWDEKSLYQDFQFDVSPTPSLPDNNSSSMIISVKPKDDVNGIHLDKIPYDPSTFSNNPLSISHLTSEIPPPPQPSTTTTTVMPIFFIPNPPLDCFLPSQSAISSSCSSSSSSSSSSLHNHTLPVSESDPMPSQIINPDLLPPYNLATAPSKPTSHHQHPPPYMNASEPSSVNLNLHAWDDELKETERLPLYEGVGVALEGLFEKKEEVDGEMEIEAWESYLEFGSD
jgi:hypothetical protein